MLKLLLMEMKNNYKHFQCNNETQKCCKTVEDGTSYPYLRDQVYQKYLRSYFYVE